MARGRNYTTSPLRSAWRLLPPRTRRYLYTRGYALVAPSIARTPPPARAGLAIAGELSATTGIGEGARIMLRALASLGVQNWAIDVGAPWQSTARTDLARFPGLQSGVPLVVHANAPTLPASLMRLPRAFIRASRIIGYWSWELSTLPREWTIGARFAHEIWVPSQFAAQAVERLHPGRVRVIPHPVAVVPPSPAALSRQAFGIPDDAVVVLVAFNLASSLERKNPYAAIAAFRAAFGDRRDRLLVLKVGHPEHFPSEFARLAEAADAPNIRLEVRDLPMADHHALLAAADIVLSLHRSEAFGLVLAEAMLLGKPVVATGWSGNMEYMDQQTAALVGYRLVTAHDGRGTYRVSGSQWADPCLADAVAHLRRLADDELERRSLGARARDAALSRLGPGRLQAAIDELGVIPAIARQFETAQGSTAGLNER
jgi:glycosyltransferase involved in cell wall biosynthesis